MNYTDSVQVQITMCKHCVNLHVVFIHAILDNLVWEMCLVGRVKARRVHV